MPPRNETFPMHLSHYAEFLSILSPYYYSVVVTNMYALFCSSFCHSVPTDTAYLMQLFHILKCYV